MKRIVRRYTISMNILVIHLIELLMIFNGNNIILILSFFLPLTKKDAILVDYIINPLAFFSPSLYSNVLPLLRVMTDQYPSIG